MTKMTQPGDEAQIRDRLDEWIRAAVGKDIEAVMACYTPDVRAFDAIGALEFVGAAAYRKHWEMCLSHMPDTTTFTRHSLDIVAQGDLAFCHCLFNCGSTDAQGETIGGWTRATICLRRIDGSWLIAHEHYSAPADMESGKTLWDLAPEGTAAASAA